MTMTGEEFERFTCNVELLAEIPQNIDFDAYICVNYMELTIRNRYA